ncbi:hypothetical protein [Halobacterium salinarum]|uniref:hypothetical protein n=1 Tax=Halobacterium salinarum TaxID=2242 RepID=UPI002555D9D5|nr:hypothetical protein [Halobacterium salinarum]MDL0134832.1 hypothetical protein [Halobacterium salinarum]
METTSLERTLDRIGLLDGASYVYNSILRYRNGATLSAEVGSLTARFHSLLHLQYQFARRGWVASVQATEDKTWQSDVHFSERND